MTINSGFFQQAVNIEQSKLLGEMQGLNRARLEAVTLANSLSHDDDPPPESADVQFGKLRIEQLEREKEAAYQALREAQEITKEWQSAMEAWRDLAQTLRDEVKACPNHEAHKFGKDDTARAKRFNNHEDDGRAKRGLKPLYAPNQK